MFIDASLKFSTAQEVTTEVVSDKILNVGKRGIGDIDMSLFINAEASIVGGNVKFILEGSSTPAFAITDVVLATKEYSPEEIEKTVNIRLSHDSHQYLRLRYAPTATLTSGSFNAMLLEGVQTNR